MPELPEVEAIRQVLDPQVRGRVVRQVTLARPEVAAHPGPAAFCNGLTGQTLAGMDRRGKFLILLLEGGGRLVLHLRMTGCLLLAPEDLPPEKHTHLTLHLDRGLELRFSDARRFGRLWLLSPGEPDGCTGLEKLGPEPFDPVLTGDYLSARLGRRRKAVKECLLDQSAVAGIGNIYADEILFAARLHPARPASSLSPEEWARLAAAIPERLAFFVEKNRTTPEEYLISKGQDYRSAPYLQVYGREGLPCPVCGTALQRTVVGGRGSVWCPACQTEHRI